MKAGQIILIGGFFFLMWKIGQAHAQKQKDKSVPAPVTTDNTKKVVVAVPGASDSGPQMMEQVAGADGSLGWELFPPNILQRFDVDKAGESTRVYDVANY